MALVARDDEVLGDLQDGERGQPQEVELHQADGLDVVLVVLAHGRVAAGLLVQRTEVGELARRNEHAPGVHADVAGHAFELLRQLDQHAHFFFLLDALRELRLHLDGVVVLVALDLFLGRVLQRDRHARLVRNQLADAVAEHVAHVQHAAHVADGRARCHGAEGGDLADGIAAVLVLHVVDHAVAVALAEVDVEVGHRDAFGVQETFEQQLVFERVQVGDLQRVGHQRARARAPARAHGAAVFLGPLDEVAHDQEVAREPHVQNGVDLELEAFNVARTFGFALGCVGVKMRQAHFEPLERLLAEEVVDRHAHAVGDEGRRKVRQLRLAEHQRQVAALGDFHRVGQRARHVGEQRLHLGARLEVLLVGEAAHAARVAQNFAFGNAHARLVRLVVFAGRELHRVRGDHRQLQAGGELHGGNHVRLVLGAAGALQLDVEAVREQAGQPQGQFGRALFLPLQQGLAERAGLRARQGDQAARELLDPFELAGRLRLAAAHVLRPGPREQLGQVQVALGALHQQHDAGERAGLLAQPVDEHFGADDGLDALAAALLVELDRPEQVVQVRDGQRGLVVGGGGLDGFVDAVGAVDDGKFGVQAQVNKHRSIVESTPSTM